MTSDNAKNSARVEWIVRTIHGEELGPFLTEALIQKISSGAFRGDEKIRKLPYGKWIDISRQAEFYDSLLSALEDAIHKKPKKNSERPRNVATEDTVVVPRSKAPVTPTGKLDISKQTLISAPPENSVSVDVETEPEALSQAQILPPHLEKPKRRGPWVAAAVGLTSLLGAILFIIAFDGQENKNEFMHLAVPASNQTDSMSQEDSNKLFKSAVGSFLLDTYEGYIDSQNKLVSVIEGAPKQAVSTEARGLLCLVYKELWPFVVQDSRDYEAVNYLTKGTRQKDPFGVNGVYCEVTRLMILGKFKDAKGLLDHSLNQPQLSSAPILFNLKAEILHGDREFQTSALYSEKAVQLWPEWLKPIVDTSRYQALAGQASAASNGYQRALKQNPSHKVAAIESAVLLYKEFHQTEKAQIQLLAAMSLPGRVQKLALAKAHFTMAEIYLEKSDQRRALESAQQSFDLNPGDPKAKDLVFRLGGISKLSKRASQTNEIVFLGDQYFRMGDCLAAQAEYKTAYDLDQKNGIAAMKAGRCLWQLNQTQEAIGWLNKAITADSKLVAAYVLQADYFSQRFAYTDAIQILNKATQIIPNNYEIMRGYGLVEFRRNNLKEALAFLSRSFKMYENDVETLILLAKVNGGLREYREAMNFALRAIELDSTNNEAQIVYAKTVAQLDGADAGISYLKSLISKFIYTLDFRIGLADLYKETERYKIAQGLYEQIVEADPRNKKAFLGLGSSLQEQGLFDKALHAYLSAAILDPSDAEGVFRTGVVYLEREKFREAIQQFERALQINPLYPRINYFMGRAYFENAQSEQALQAALAERKINPGLADSYLLAAEVYAATKQFTKCAEEYQSVIKIRPQGAEIYVKLARCYRQGGSPDIAENMLNIAATQESGMAEIYKEQGAIYETKGDAHSAIKAYSKYLALSPNAQDRAQMESQIRKLSTSR